jgi:phosphoglycerate dehydrogenase-like enzyme
LRIHLQSKLGTTNFPLTKEVWDEAAVRAPDVSGGHQLSFGNDAEAFAAGMSDAEVLIAQTAAMVPGLPPSPKLRLIYVTSAGLEKLAPFDWLPDGVALMNNRGTHAEKAGEFGLMALLMLINRMPALMTAQRAGKWAPIHGAVLRRSHLVVVGLGTLGGTAAQHAKNFGMRVTGVRMKAEPHPACDRVVTVDQFDSVIGDAELLYLATPLTDATRHLLDRARIAKLPKGAGVANVGRGGLIEQEALLDALDSGHVGGAVLDVFDPEPIPPGHRLWTTPNLIITPHTSADDPVTYNARSLDIFFDNLRAFRAGSPLPNRFDTARGY